MYQHHPELFSHIEQCDHLQGVGGISPSKQNNSSLIYIKDEGYLFSQNICQHDFITSSS